MGDMTTCCAMRGYWVPRRHCSSFSGNWYEYHLPRRGFEIEELTPNGDWFAYCEQELMRLGGWRGATVTGLGHSHMRWACLVYCISRSGAASGRMICKCQDLI